MPPLDGTTPSEHQPPELFGRHISDQHRPAATFEECNDPLSLLRCGAEARPAQSLAYLGLLPDELGRDGVLDDDDPSPAIGEAGGRRSALRGKLRPITRRQSASASRMMGISATGRCPWRLRSAVAPAMPINTSAAAAGAA